MARLLSHADASGGIGRESLDTEKRLFRVQAWDDRSARVALDRYSLCSFGVQAGTPAGLFRGSSSVLLHTSEASISSEPRLCPVPLSVNRRPRLNPVHQPRNPQWVAILQRFRQPRVRVVLVAHRAQETLDGQGAHRGASGVRGGRVRTAVDHRVADFHAGRIAVEQQAPCLLFQERYQVGEGRQVFRFGDQGRGELPVQPMQRALQFGVVGDLDDHAGRAEDFFLQQLVALQQQADVRLEQLRPGLAALLRLPGEMADARVGVQRRQAFS